MFSAELLPSRLLEFFIAASLIMLAPGPSVLFTIARAIAWGRKAALATVLGNAFGMFLFSALFAIGLGPLLQSSKPFYYAIQFAGGAYLIYLGYSAIKESKVDAKGMTSTQGGRPSVFTSIKNGFWVGVLNPKSLVFFAAILPAFVDQEKSNVTSQLLFLGAIFAFMALLSDGTYGILAGTVRNWLAGDLHRLVFMRRFGGIVMIGLGIFTFISAGAIF